jgi:DNA-binding transcriptional MocR family regulator
MRTRTTKKADHLYLRIARSIEQQIDTEVLKVGDKLPSIRMICRQHGISMSTAQYAYHELERKSLIEPRPQSGYYVSNSFRRKLAVPAPSRPLLHKAQQPGRNIFGEVFNNGSQKNVLLFSRGVPANELLPLAKLNKGVLQAVRNLEGSGAVFEPIEGNTKLRTQIAKWAFAWKGTIATDEVITTAGCINAIAYCMMALTKRGDTIAVESPCYYGVLQLAHSLGLKVLELPASPQTGVDLDALKKLIGKQKIRLCLFVSNFNNPVGSLMPDEHKKAAVQLLLQHNIPLIEDDIYGELYFGNSRPTCCKAYDEAGMVLLCSSVSKTLASGYRVGWVMPGKFREELLKIKFFHSLSNTTLTHEVIADFLENGRYEAHLRKLRQTLHTNYLQYVRVISQHFPEETKISRPQGGLSLWVELPAHINTIDLYYTAIRQKISIAPGSMYTLQQQYHNCMRLSYGLQWNEKVEYGLKVLGKLVKAAM